MQIKLRILVCPQKSRPAIFWKALACIANVICQPRINDPHWYFIKWTIRSDRVQNSRAEALNLIRNRKGRLPHIVVVTSEPLPSRIASIALGTGDLDCIYHFALPELIESVNELNAPDSAEMLQIMLDGKRLKDISDLPLDLAV